jgi:fatty acid desaturase
MLSSSDWVGFLASALVLLTFAMRDMRLLRAAAIVSNVAFIAYGILLWLPPVVALHALLLPINVFYLVFGGRQMPASRDADGSAAAKATRLAVEAIRHSVAARSKPRLTSGQVHSGR